MGDRYPNSGILFDNSPAVALQGKSLEDAKPALSGNFSTDCPHCNRSQHWTIAAWPRQGRQAMFYTLKIGTKEAQDSRSASPRPATTTPQAPQADSGLPF